jgi:uncharacterized protein (TIGR03089 family)
MHLAPPPSSKPAPDDLPRALQDAAELLGHRPAVTLLSPRGREEQGVASLRQWAAKGAHLLEADLLLEPGDRVALRAPVGWGAAAVALAAWWAGLVVTLDGDAEVAVVHEGRQAPPGAQDVLWLGDAVDGSPLSEVATEAWAVAVQAFPDQPPPPRGEGRHLALEADGSAWTQAELLARVEADGVEGTLGIDAGTIDPVEGLLAVAIRPLLASRPTVVLAGVGRAVAEGERVAVWR